MFLLKKKILKIIKAFIYNYDYKEQYMRFSKVNVHSQIYF